MLFILIHTLTIATKIELFTMFNVSIVLYVQWGEQKLTSKHDPIENGRNFVAFKYNSMKYKSFYQIPSICRYTLQFRAIQLRKPRSVSIQSNLMPCSMVDLNKFERLEEALHNRRKIAPLSSATFPISA